MKLLKASLRVNILSIFVILLCSTVLFIILYTYFNNSRTMLEQAEKSIDTVSSVGVEKVAEYLKPAAWLAKFSAHALSEHIVNFQDNTKIETMTMEMLREFPQVAMFNLADTHGNFLMVKRMKDGTFSTKVIRCAKGRREVLWKHRNHNGNIIRRETVGNDTYDPRVRPWYKKAMREKKLVWSGLYFFFTDRKPGISASYPIFSNDGKTNGVLCFDIELSALSEMMRRLSLSANSHTLLVNTKNEIVACEKADLQCTLKNGKMQAVKSEDFDDGALQCALLAHHKNGSNKFYYQFNDKNYLAVFAPLPKNSGAQWKLAIITPESDLIGDLINSNRISLLISLLILLIGILLVSLLATLISRPITRLTAETLKIKNFELGGELNNNSHIKEIRQMYDAVDAMKKGLRSFNKYVPSELVRQLIASGKDAKIGGEHREISLMFTDVENFTTIAEKLPPQLLMQQISDYLSELSTAVKAHHGTIDKFIGDSVMAFWNAPLNIEDHAFHCCSAALECRRRMDIFNEKLAAEGFEKMKTRIGLHCGDAVIGNLGSSDRMNYTAVGDSVNLASRLEGANKFYGTYIMLSEDMYKHVCDKFVFRKLDKVAVKGKKHGGMVYELVAEKDDTLDESVKIFISRFETALDLYFKREWQRALEMLDHLKNEHPNDKSLAVYIERCRYFMDNDPGPDWDGIFTMTEK